MTRSSFVLTCFVFLTAALPSLGAHDRKPKSLRPLASVLLSVNPAFASRTRKTLARNSHVRLDEDPLAAFEREMALLEGTAVDEPEEATAAPEPTTTPVTITTRAPTTTRAPATTKKAKIGSKDPAKKPEKGLQNLISAYTIDGNKLPMSTLADSAVLMVNVASKCGTAKRVYTEIHGWHKKYGDSLKILLYPSDEFGDAELQREEIRPFLETFEPTQGMPLDGPVWLMDKASVNGKFPPEIWELAKEAFPGDIRWNFEGFFLFDTSGVCVGRFKRDELDKVGEAIQAHM